MTISENRSRILQRIQHLQEARPIDDPVQLMAVSKYYTPAQFEAMLATGQRLFGENKVQDLIQKCAQYPDVDWHMIGHLQTNKIKKVVPLVSCIQSVDSLRVLEKINLECENIQKVMPILLQVNVANDPAKFGFTLAEATDLIENTRLNDFVNLYFRGIMTIVPEEHDPHRLRGYFASARQLFERAKQCYSTVDTLSMGMSGDYELAIEEGSTLVRLGRQLVEGYE